MFVPQTRRDLIVRSAVSRVTTNRTTKGAFRFLITNKFKEKSIDVAAP